MMSKKPFLQRILDQKWLLLFILPAFAYFLIFSYLPMYGILIAFKNYTPGVSSNAFIDILNAPWVGFKYFTRFFSSYYFGQILSNTIVLSLMGLVIGFPLPIILALTINEAKDGFFKKFTQTVTYAPYFISVVVVCGMLIAFLNPTTGILTHFLEFFGIKNISFMTDPRYFKIIYVLSDVWQGTGWGSVIYLAALSGVDTQLHEAAIIDGASRWQRVIYINFPILIPTMVILLIMSVGNLMAMGYEKIILLQNPLNLDSSNVIATFVYKTGLLDAQYSYAAAVGLFNSVINCVLLLSVNKIARKVSDISLL
ncbi:MAG: ABC transporter permease subunit [Bifidobacteriaceae bacterium]|jgi:putative aldouronate transport system permease protein|nr:ABC transporter permease subunit [Bifidobacteriaceae bacterium]